MTDIQMQWKCLMGRNAGEIISFSQNLVREYWRLTEQPRDQKAIDAYYLVAVSGDYLRLISESMEFVLEQTGIQLDNSYLLQESLDKR